MGVLLQPCSLPRPHFLIPADGARLTPVMPGWLSIPSLCLLLLPWAFIIFHQALGDPGKTSEPPRIWKTVGRLQVWGTREGQLLEVPRSESLLSGQRRRGSAWVLGAVGVRGFLPLWPPLLSTPPGPPLPPAPHPRGHSLSSWGHGHAALRPGHPASQLQGSLEQSGAGGAPGSAHPHHQRPARPGLRGPGGSSQDAEGAPVRRLAGHRGRAPGGRGPVPL